MQRSEYSVDILNAMEALSASGVAPKWGAGLEQIDRRNVFLGELSKVGIRKSDTIGKPSVRNDAAFLYTLVGVTSVVAVAAGQLPGDWVNTRYHSYFPCKSYAACCACGSLHSIPIPNTLTAFCKAF